ncbi:Crp/Fnr family transcriptional regulator [Daejeonella oryzae]|uniref:Crp/Fnr family transcriptional regulator n=1 Tax=Daejeonella oryzae TaxID=1122943 RepID=UPI00040C31B1|nr:Crp/Fnr family transcriptional regulator [Daejeonella oryzae]
MENSAHINSLFLLFEKYQPTKENLSGKLKDFLAGAVKERCYRKKHLILNEDDVPLYAWYIVKGSARVYFYDPKARREITRWFWYEGDLMLYLRSFFRQKEAGEFIELLQESTLLLISARDIDIMIRQFPEYRFFERALLEEYHTRMSDHTNDLVSLIHRHKFLKLMKTHKEIFNLAYLKDIASFLNMHPAALSRLRSEK